MCLIALPSKNYSDLDLKKSPPLSSHNLARAPMVDPNIKCKLKTTDYNELQQHEVDRVNMCQQANLPLLI